MPKILLLDIETAPAVAYVWGLHDQNININQVVHPSYILCWSAQWLDGKMEFSKITEGEKTMLRRIRDLLDEADAVVHYNGTSFDIPILNREFIKHKIPPPSPYKQIDLFRVVRSVSRFDSGKLAFVSKELQIGEKAATGGFELWDGCMHNNQKAWKTMEKYNRQDVSLLVDLYRRLLPWITNHPQMTEGAGRKCARCGSTHVQLRGKMIVRGGAYARFQCQDCGGWSRGATLLEKRNEERIVPI